MSFTNLSKKARASVLIQAKRQRAKNLFRMSCDERSIPVGTTLQSLYAEANRELFCDKLPFVPVVYNNRLRKTLGKAYYRIDSGGVFVPIRIELRSNHRWTDRFKKKVLIHEMCHVWAYHFHNEPGHGKKFWEQMTKLGYPKFHDFENSLPWERDIYC